MIINIYFRPESISVLKYYLRVLFYQKNNLNYNIYSIYFERFFETVRLSSKNTGLSLLVAGIMHRSIFRLEILN